jgi:hypothetical protein
MTSSRAHSPSCTFEDAEREHLRTGIRLSTEAKIAFFEEMIELAWHSGALTPERLALRDRDDGRTR